MHLFLAFIGLLPEIATLAAAFPGLPPNETDPMKRGKSDYLRWAIMGDTWASGVPLGDRADTSDPHCLRISDAYSFQLFQDNSWTQASEVLTFMACAGSRLGRALGQAQDMSKDKDGKYTVKNKFATMTPGADDAGLYQVAVDCFYQPDWNPDAYGPAYPDPNSKCKKSLNEVRDNIRGAREHQKDNKVNIYEAIDSVMRYQREEVKNKDFDLYITGYAHFFNADDGSTWCNNQSFGVVERIHKPLLSLQLRREVNDLISELNDLIRQAVDERKDKHVHYVNISPNFDGHRWCEPNQTKNTDLFPIRDESKAWFFNFSLLIMCDFSKDNIQLPLFNFDIPWDKFNDYVPKCLKGRNRGEYLRPFSPTRLGQEAIKRHIKDALGDKYKKG